MTPELPEAGAMRIGPVGSASMEPRRDEARAGPAPRYKRPESVLVVIFTRAGEVLMLRRTSPPGFWQSVTGSLQRGETIRAAAIREVREETGISASSAVLDLGISQRFPIPPCWRGSRYAPGVHYNLEHWLALPLPHRRTVQLDPREHLEHLWLPAARAAALTGSWTNRLAIQMVAGMTGLGR